MSDSEIPRRPPCVSAAELTLRLPAGHLPLQTRRALGKKEQKHSKLFMSFHLYFTNNSLGLFVNHFITIKLAFLSKACVEMLTFCYPPIWHPKCMAVTLCSSPTEPKTEIKVDIGPFWERKKKKKKQSGEGHVFYQSSQDMLRTWDPCRWKVSEFDGNDTDESELRST